MLFSTICVALYLLEASHARQLPTEDYLHHSILDVDQKVLLYWKFNDTHITFEIHVQTTGWVGLGISPSGSMQSADIHVGWVKNGTAVITDRHGSKNTNTYPPLDVEQNLELLTGIECDGWTVVKFQRQLAACEADQDVAITSDTIKLIYAYGSTDPDGDDLSSQNYHQQARGSKSMLLLDPASSDQSMFPEGETHLSFSLTNDNFALPTLDTYYNCRLHKLPQITGKHHLVKIEPIIQPGNEFYLHHMLVFSCTDEITNSEVVGANAECYTSNMPPEWNSCQFVMHAWATGAGAFHYPKHVGIPLGTEDSPRYVVIETHYDNPALNSDVVDSSGMKFTYTPQLRQYDGAVIEVGHSITSYNHVIPPNAESFLDTGECMAGCIGSAMLQENRQDINIFAVQLHAHLLAKQLKLRHVRNGVELAPIAIDRSYDFNFQETRHLKNELPFKADDSMQVVCNYKSKGVRPNITLGGFSTSEEMCEAFVYYYPKIDMTYCFTAPPLRTMLGHFGIKNYTGAPTNIYIEGSLKTVEVTEPKEFAGKSAYDVLNAWPWDEAAADAFAAAMTLSAKEQVCGGSKGPPPGASQIAPALKIDEKYLGQTLNCTEPSHEMATSGDSESCPAPVTDPAITTSGSESQFICSLIYILVLYVTFSWL